jgi:broad specificity phosphatase PhoE
MTQRLFLLRHGEVTSHRGDVPVTEEGLQTAEQVGRRLAARADGPIRVISGETRRTRDTAAAVARGAREAGAEVSFFAEWLTAPDRVGWWVRHPEPPGDDAAAVADRIRTFAASLADREDATAFTVAITHSPVLRACAVEVTGGDIGEPQWLAGLEAEVSADRSVRLQLLPEAP